ncbi:hypothetical protein HPB52_005001 [Rhipicephalus sanguineus]|uniref:Uncharacterized protein n=1 Tax=Rhipicephalus sanguineus TaxID=34632 RepID=A0A9D4T8K7_RHISA|nr:hypothetical protein HPB52_005001 [Rhipicephalus sanguineus]
MHARPAYAAKFVNSGGSSTSRAPPSSREVTYLGLTIDHRLTWIPAAKVRRVQGAVARLHQRGQGCTVQWALRLNQAAATSILLYALPLVLLSPVII